jgi:hypothetical protein
MRRHGKWRSPGETAGGRVSASLRGGRSGSHPVGGRLRRGLACPLTLDLLLQVAHLTQKLVQLAIEFVDLLWHGGSSGPRSRVGAAARTRPTWGPRSVSTSWKSSAWKSGGILRRGPLFTGWASGSCRGIGTWFIGLSRPGE